MVAPHPEQMPSLLQWVTENKSLDQNNDMVIDKPDHAVASSSTCPVSIPDNMAVLPYEDELEFLTWISHDSSELHLSLSGGGCKIYILSLVYN